MTWAEALVRRVILFLVTEMRRDSKTSRADPSEGWDPSHILDACVDGEETLPTVIPEHGEAVVSGTQNDLTGSRVSSAAMDCCTAHGMTSDDQPPRPYRPTFQWSELRPAPTIPKGNTNTAPRPKPRKHDFKTKVEARLALFAHMLEHKEAYAKRLAFRLNTVGRIKAEPDPTSLLHVSVPSEGLEPTYCPAAPETEGKTPPPFTEAGGDQKLNSISTDRLSASEAEGPETLSVVIPGAAQHDNDALPTRDPEDYQVPHLHSSTLCRSTCGMTPEPPKLVWSLYTTEPPPIEALRDDLVALHMAYEQP